MPSSIAKYNKNLNERRNGFMKIKNRLNYDNIQKNFKKFLAESAQET